MREIVINATFGGFGLSLKAIMRYAELKNLKLYPWVDEISKDVYGKEATLDNTSIFLHYTTVPKEEYRKIKEEEDKKPVKPSRYEKSNALYFSDGNIPRDDKDLIMIVKEMGSEANACCAELKIVKIPDYVNWEIEEYDGAEWVSEKHRTWR